MKRLLALICRAAASHAAVQTPEQYFGFRIGEVPVRTIYSEEASSVGPAASVVYGLKTLGAVARLVLHRRGLLRSRKFMP